MATAHAPRLETRRARVAQRRAVDSALPDDWGSVLRLANGQVLVYDEQPFKREPVSLRAVIMPEGDVVDLRRRRFRR